MNLGKRIIFNQNGDIICEFGEMVGNITEREVITHLDYVDLEYDSIDYNKYRLIGIDINTKEPILEELIQEPDPIVDYIKELEEQLGITNSRINYLLQK